MPPNDPIDRAIEAVEPPLLAFADKNLTSEKQRKKGEKAREHRIRPSRHPDCLRDTAPGLADLLRDAEMIVIADESERQARLSRMYKNRFSRKWIATAIAAFVFTVASGLVLATNAALPADDACRKSWASAFSIIALIAGALGAGLVVNIRGTGVFALWNKARAQAEEGKTQLATRLAALATPSANDAVFVRLCQFEYIRHIVLDFQLKYYADTADRERRRADRLTLVESFAAALTALAAAGVALGVRAGGDLATWLPLCGVFAGALTTFAASLDQMYQHRQLAALYEDAHRSLNLIQARVGDVRKALAAGSEDALPAFIKAALEPMRAEHQKWLERGAGVQEALDRLEKTLQPKKPAQGGAASTT